MGTKESTRSLISVSLLTFLIITCELDNFFKEILQVITMRLLICVLLLSKLSLTQLNSDKSEQFWIEAELLKVNWMRTCLTTGGCAEPRFRIVKSSITTKEQLTISWPVTQNLVQVINLNLRIREIPSLVAFFTKWIFLPYFLNVLNF